MASVPLDAHPQCKHTEQDSNVTNAVEATSAPLYRMFSLSSRIIRSLLTHTDVLFNLNLIAERQYLRRTRIVVGQAGLSPVSVKPQCSQFRRSPGTGDPIKTAMRSHMPLAVSRTISTGSIMTRWLSWKCHSVCLNNRSAFCGRILTTLFSPHLTRSDSKAATEVNKSTRAAGMHEEATTQSALCTLFNPAA